MDEPVRGQHLVPWVSVVEAPLPALPGPSCPSVAPGRCSVGLPWAAFYVEPCERQP